jgi:hypothetical protein
MRLAIWTRLAGAAIVFSWTVYPAAAENFAQPAPDQNAVETPYNATPVIPANVEGGLTATDPVTGLVAYVDWLNWTYRSPNLNFADTQFFHGGGQVGVSDDNIGAPQNSGIRLGLGYRFQSGWDVTWSFTHFAAGGTGSAVAPPTNGLNNGAVIPPGTALALPFGAAGYTSVTASANMTYDVNDIDFGRWVVYGDGLAVRYFGGVRWAMTTESISEAFSPAFAFPGSGAPTDTYGNYSSMDALGIRAGAECHWHILNTGLSLFGRGATSVLLGKFDNSETILDNQGNMVSVANEDLHAVVVLEAAAGVEWQVNNWEIAAGYELAAWLNQASIQDAVVFNPSNSYGTMLLDGLFVRLAYNY